MIFHKKIEDRDNARFILENYISTLIEYGNKLPSLCSGKELERRRHYTAIAIDDLEGVLEILDYIYTQPNLIKDTSKTINRAKKYIDTISRLIYK